MHLFYTPDIAGNQYTLSESESKHCTRVLRLKEGDHIQLIDGKGGFYTAQITQAHHKKCIVEVTEEQQSYGKRDFYLHIAIAPTKNIDRLEWFLEKATEIGVDEITPILCDHSERKIIKPERLEKIIVSAMKQSYKAYKPILNPITSIKELFSSDFDGDRYIAHCEDTNRKLFRDEIAKKEKVLVLIGPEGDFSPSEIDSARENQFTEISLGSSRLRTETAGVVACHTVNLLND
ncbi:16S rRNA (uracil(1498)-N(3))-methyltransferase [Puteibacter caeruleilacunae]|nr:16S rRNA (uracil(1498)-N(3))-methyltransferase [Puteibacter caeruleilacunae]